MGAYTSGIAADCDDFLTQLVNFLTTDSGLTGAGQAWTTVWTAPVGAPNETDIVLRGPGLSSTGTIFVGLRLNKDEPNDQFSLSIVGMTGTIPSATTFDGHINCAPVPVRIFLDDAPMTYWFSATGRKFTATAKVSTVYETAYAGLFLPFSQPQTYNYPMLIGGMASANGVAEDWRSTDADHTAFVSPPDDSVYETTAWVINPIGEWLRCGVSGDSVAPITLGPGAFGAEDFGMSDVMAADAYGYLDIVKRTGACYGGDYTLTPVTVVQSYPQNQTFGILDGVYHVPGRSNAAENIVNFNSKGHLVVQNGFRTGIGDYFAVALED